VKVYHRHRCTSAHRSYRMFAQCIFGQRSGVVGEGPYALIARCSHLQVMLFDSEDAALDCKQAIDLNSCGPECHKHHELVQLLKF
jgi:hypothetical protein